MMKTRVNVCTVASLIDLRERKRFKHSVRDGLERRCRTVLIAALVVLATLAGCGARRSANEPVIMETKTRSVVEDGRSVLIHYPSITACADAKAMKWFNERMQSIADSVYICGLKCPSSFTLEYDVVHNADGIVSLLFQSFCDGSAEQQPHGLLSFNADLIAMKEIGLADLFDPSSPWLHRVSQLCRSELRIMLEKQGVDDTSMIEEGTGEDAANFKTFVITRDTLGIKFGSGRVACYSAGEPMVILPFNRIADVLAGNGVAGRMRK